MEGTPEGIGINNVINTMQKIKGVNKIHHVHIWQLDEQRNALEAHVSINNDSEMNVIKKQLKQLLHDDFSLEHSTLEFE